MNAFLSLPVSLPVSLSPTQLDATLIRLPLTSRIVQLPQTFEMYTPFNQFRLSGIAGWMTGKKLDCIPSFATGCHLSVLGLLLFACQGVCITFTKSIYVLFQGAGSNVIRCRKDGNWTGSFRLCPHSKGHCSLPQNLHYSLQYSCKRGHGIGLYAQIYCFVMKQFSLVTVDIIFHCLHHSHLL